MTSEPYGRTPDSPSWEASCAGASPAGRSVSRNATSTVVSGGKQREEGRRRVRRVTYRDVQFIRGHHFQRRISIFTPVLVSDNGDFNGVAWSGAFWMPTITRAVARNRTTTVRIGMTFQASST
jgi:hypothetical protein